MMQGKGKGKARGHAEDKERFSLSQILSVMVIGAAICLLALNYWQAMDCPANNPDAMEEHIDSLARRLTESERLLSRNTDQMERLMKDMETDLVALGQSERTRIRDEALREAVQIAVQQSKIRTPPMPYNFIEKHGLQEGNMDYYGLDGSSSGRTDLDFLMEGDGAGETGNRLDDYITGTEKGALDANGNPKTKQFHDDVLVDDKQSMQQWKDPDSFGGHSGKKTKSFESPWDDDDKSSSKSNGGKNARDDFDDPGSASEAGEVFRDNLSDADARSICNAWKS